MTDATDRPTIDALLADRARFETWIEQLAAKSSQVPSHVVERVHADYQSRLDAVLAALTDRADELQSEASTLADRVTALDAELAAKRDARAEDELRALVGEHDDALWQARAAEHDASIAAVEAERETCAAERDRLRSMLRDATRPSTTGSHAVIADGPATMGSESVESARGSMAESAVEPMEEPVVAASVDAEATEPTPPPTATAHTPQDHPQQSDESADRDGISDLLPTPTFNAPPSPRASRQTAFDEIAFLDTVVGRPTPVAPPVQSPVESVGAADEVLPPLEPSPDGRGASITPDGARSLKCQECGWMNVPTEWYCEKCGGELSAF